MGKTISLMSHDEDAHLNMPSAPVPIPDVDGKSLMHPALVTELTECRPYYRKGGLIPRLSKRGFFWKNTRPAIHDPEAPALLISRVPGSTPIFRRGSLFWCTCGFYVCLCRATFHLRTRFRTQVSKFLSRAMVQHAVSWQVALFQIMGVLGLGSWCSISTWTVPWWSKSPTS